MFIVSRMSSRVFMGEELCNDQEWIEASSQYTSSLIPCALKLSEWPRVVRPVVHRFLPGFAELRRRLRRCEAVLQPHIDRRLEVKAAAAAEGKPYPYNDSIEWFSREFKGMPHNPAGLQIGLSLVAVHTTTDLLVQTMLDIARHPEILSPLREEAIRILSADGLDKTAFHKLNLMDSCFKESQRLRPVFLGE